MARSGPVTLALPSFGGATRKLILVHLGIFFGVALISLFARTTSAYVFVATALSPYDIVHGQIWRVLTYGFTPLPFISALFALLTLWFVGSMLEDSRGERWLYELYFTSIVVGGIVATAVAWTHLFHIDPMTMGAAGARAGNYGLLVALAMVDGDQEFLLFFLVRLKVRYLVALYVIIQLALLVTESGAFSALTLVSAALGGYLFVKFVPRRGLAYGVTERYFAMRNEYYRNKRRRAARKFEVYMKAQNREVHFDQDGRYVDPDKDPTDKRWMN